MQRNLILITIADFIARAAYQMGKTPLLPIFAATLGAGDVFLGLIVSVSTFTGMVLKPVVGVLSDRWGRRWWMLVGTAFFAGMPFLYRFVHTPEQLFAIRMIHGLATAIYGPVTLAYVTEQMGKRRAEGLGWFGIGRSGGYIVGPALAGWLLLTLDPVQVFTIIGLMSCATFVPVLLLQERAVASDGSGAATDTPAAMDSIWRQGRAALAAGARTPALWLAGGLEAVVFIALYAAKAFLPIYALSAGFDVALVGLFFSLQEAVHALVKPFAGRWADRMGYGVAIAGGMLLMAAALPLLSVVGGAAGLLGLSVAMGLGQALVFPATVALIAEQIDGRHVGAGMGLLGTLQNGGKVLGPVLGGLLAGAMGYQVMFLVMGLLLVVGAAGVWQLYRSPHRPPGQGEPAPGDD